MEKIKFEQFIFKGLDGKEIKAFKMEPKKIEATFHIAHGLNEYSRRYQDFVDFLYSKNIAVYALDNRGFGETIGDATKLGAVDKGDINQTINDHIILSKLIREKNPDVPSVMFGHSYGSFLTQKYIQQYHQDDLIMISGSSGKIPFIFLAKWAINIFSLTGPNRRSAGLAKMATETKADYLGEIKTPVDWLTRDPQVCLDHMNDPYCNQVLPTSWYCYMLKFMKSKNLYSKKGLNQINKEIPIYIFSGKNDPAGGRGKTVTRLAKMYEEELGIKNVSLKLYEGGRHEMLKDINKEEVYQDLYKEIKKLIK